MCYWNSKTLNNNNNNNNNNNKKSSGVLPDLMAPMAASSIAPMASLLIQHVASSLLKGIFGKRVSEVQEGGIL